MVKIFKNKTASNARKPTKVMAKKERQERAAAKLDGLNPMVVPMLAVQLEKSPNNDFMLSSVDVVLNRPYQLTDKWVASLNKWVEALMNKVLLDPPDIEEGSRVDLGPFIVSKIVDPKPTAAYPVPAIISIDDRGWSWYFKTSKAYSFAAGDLISFRATVSSHKEGITFLRRASKINKCLNINGEESD